MADLLDITEVTRMTGLTPRALRFYEARGLLRPVRDFSGRRQYGAAQLEALHRIIAMKRAGLTLAQIQSMTAAPRLNLHSILSVCWQSASGKSPLRANCFNPSCPASSAASPSMSRLSAR